MEQLISQTELAAFRAFLQGSALKVAEVDITTAEIKAINATPITLAAAPGAGYVNEFISAVLILDYVSAAYATNGILGVYETNAAGTVLSTTALLANFLAKTEDWVVVLQALSADTALLANKALVLTAAAAETITGNSPVRAKIAYRTHATGL